MMLVEDRHRNRVVVFVAEIVREISVLADGVETVELVLAVELSEVKVCTEIVGRWNSGGGGGVTAESEDVSAGDSKERGVTDGFPGFIDRW